MSRRSSRKRKGMPVWVAALILAALFVVSGTWWLVLHVGPALGVLVIMARVYYLGRRHESKRPRIGQGAARKQTAASSTGSRGKLTADLAGRARTADARFRRNGWLPPAGQETADLDEPPF